MIDGFLELLIFWNVIIIFVLFLEHHDFRDFKVYFNYFRDFDVYFIILRLNLRDFETLTTSTFIISPVKTTPSTQASRVFPHLGHQTR